MKVILLGATGRIGAATLRNLLAHHQITSIIALTRRPLTLEHPRLKNIIHKDVTVWPPNFVRTELFEAQALIWTLGIRPSLVKSYDEAKPIEVDAPVSAATALINELGPWLGRENKKFRMVYVSGMASERNNNRALWFANDARKLKGETENELAKLERDHSEIFEAYVAKSGHVVADSGSGAMLGGLLPNLVIRESELAMGMIDLAIAGSDKRSLTNSELVNRGRTAIQALDMTAVSDAVLNSEQS